MKRIIALALFCVAADWKSAEPGWEYEFPRDHHAHTEFKTEWWYFTGNVFDQSGRRFGYELTFFRQGIRPPDQRDPALSRFVIGDLKFAHFTVTDVTGKQFRFEEKTSRGAFGEAGFDDGDRIAWIDDWQLTLDGNAFEIRASMPEANLHLRLTSAKPPVIHGRNGISAKASDAGHASHYYSLTRLTSSGELQLRGNRFALHGDSWFDHEWATNQLAPGQVGWDWLSVYFDDRTELMLYQMRLENGAPDPSSSGTFIAQDGSSTYLPGSAFRMTPLERWRSKKTGANYPIAWRVELAERNLQFTVRAVLDDQELATPPIIYWEGAVDVEGTRKGRGYLELTGYAAALQELQR